MHANKKWNDDNRIKWIRIQIEIVQCDLCTKFQIFLIAVSFFVSHDMSCDQEIALTVMLLWLLSGLTERRSRSNTWMQYSDAFASTEENVAYILNRKSNICKRKDSVCLLLSQSTVRRSLFCWRSIDAHTDMFLILKMTKCTVCTLYMKYYVRANSIAVERTAHTKPTHKGRHRTWLLLIHSTRAIQM